TAENYGSLDVAANGDALALAIGMGAIQAGDGGNTLHNHGTVTVAAQGHSDGDGAADVAAAIGMGGIGTGHVLENTADGSLDVSAEGSNALAVGLAALGIGNKAANAGILEVKVEAVSAGEPESVDPDASAYALADRPDWLEWLEALIGEIDGAAAAGMIGSGAGNILENQTGGKIAVNAVGQEAGAVGMFMTGTGSIDNANGAEVSASTEDGKAVGIMALATGGQVSVLNDGTVGATGGNEAAGMYVAAHNIPGGRNGEVVLTNNGVIEAHSAGAAAGVIIGAGVDGLPLGTVHIVNE